MTTLLPRDPIPLQQGAIYRARLSVPCLGTKDAVRDGLTGQGWQDVEIWDAGGVPSNWPSDQRDSPGSCFGPVGSRTLFLQGRFGLSDRSIPLSDIESKHVDVLAMWLHAAAASTVSGADALSVSPGDGLLRLDPSSAFYQNVYLPALSTQAYAVPSQPHAPGAWVRVAVPSPVISNLLVPTMQTGAAWVAERTPFQAIVLDRAGVANAWGLYLIAMPSEEARALAAGPNAVVAMLDEAPPAALPVATHADLGGGEKLVALGIGAAVGWAIARLAVR